jgi:hypothetical protein
VIAEPVVVDAAVQSAVAAVAAESTAAGVVVCTVGTGFRRRCWAGLPDTGCTRRVGRPCVVAAVGLRTVRCAWRTGPDTGRRFIGTVGWSGAAARARTIPTRTPPTNGGRLVIPPCPRHRFAAPTIPAACPAETPPPARSACPVFAVGG